MGSTLSRAVHNEITLRTAEASVVFVSLRANVWDHNGIKRDTKLKVYKVVVLPTLVYACESSRPIPAASPLIYSHGAFVVGTCVMKLLCEHVRLRNKMTCAMKLEYREEEVRSICLTHSSSPNYVQRQDKCQCV